MPRVCTVCSHPKRNEIDKALAEPFTVKRRIARRYGLHPSAVERHALEHLPLRIAAAASNGSALSARNLLDRVTTQLDKLETLSASSFTSGDAETFLETAAQLRPTLELLGRVTREIQPESVVQVTLGLFQRLNVRDEDELKARLSSLDEYAGLAEPEIATRMATWLGRYLQTHPDESPRLAALAAAKEVA